MRKFFTVSFLTTISLFSKEELMVDGSMAWLRWWLIASLLAVGLMFWSIYKAMKTKNPKYGWGMALSLVLLTILLFV